MMYFAIWSDFGSFKIDVYSYKNAYNLQIEVIVEPHNLMESILFKTGVSVEP